METHSESNRIDDDTIKKFMILDFIFISKRDYFQQSFFIQNSDTHEIFT